MSVWHGIGLSGPDLAKDYASCCSGLRHRTPDALAFLRWLHTHPKVMFERAAVLKWSEVLLWEHDPEQRQKIFAAERAELARIDEGLSREIVVKRADRNGRMVSPWLCSGRSLGLRAAGEG